MAPPPTITQLLHEEHSARQRDRVVAFVGHDERRFVQLMEIFFGTDYRMSQRAAWPAGAIAEDKPELLKPYIGKLISKLGNNPKDEAVTRNTLRILQYTKIPKRWHGKLMEICFRLVQTPKTAPAIKAYSLTILANFTLLYPDIAAELRLLITELWDTESPAFRARGRHILSSLKS